jgi:uncharacterized phage protein gp47/JayE
MPFSRPTLTALITRGLEDLRLAVDGPVLRQSNLATASEVMAGLVDGVYAGQAYTARQVIPDTAETEFLEMHATRWGITRIAATSASGSLTVTGTTGVVVPSGTVFARADGARVASTAAVTLADGTATVAVTADTAGIDGNADAATGYLLTSAISGVDAAATVVSPGLSGGAAAESDAALLSRLLERMQRPPHGGAAHDYRAWASTVAGVTRVWALPSHSGLGTVGVAFAMDDADDGPIPDSGTIALVQAAVDAERPVTADVTAFAPTALSVDVEITGLSPDTTAVRAAVELELADLFRRAGDLGTVLPISKIWEAVSIAAGEQSHTITAPAGNVTPTAVQLPVLGTVSYA